MLVHAEEKPYICETCGKVIKSVINLNSHRTVQTGEKPFICGYYDRSFTCACTLETHMIEHA